MHSPTEGNLRRALQQLNGIRERIENGTFCFTDEFPGFRDLAKIDTSGQVRSCNDVFDELLKHCESRMAKNDMAFVTMDGYRKILKQVWRPATLKCLRITKKDRPVIDPFTIHEAEALIAAIHRDCAASASCARQGR